MLNPHGLRFPEFRATPRETCPTCRTIKELTGPTRFHLFEAEYEFQVGKSDPRRLVRTWNAISRILAPCRPFASLLQNL